MTIDRATTKEIDYTKIKFTTPYFLKPFCKKSNDVYCDEKLYESRNLANINRYFVTFENAILRNLCIKLFNLKIHKRKHNFETSEINIVNIKEVAQQAYHLTDAERSRKYEELRLCYDKALRHWIVYLLNTNQDLISHVDPKLQAQYRADCLDKTIAVESLVQDYLSVRRMIGEVKDQQKDKKAQTEFSPEIDFIVTKVQTDPVLYKKFTERHLEMYAQAGIFSRSRFAALVDAKKITDFDDVIKYVAANPHSRAAWIFVRTGLPKDNAYARFIQKHISNCQSSFTSYVGSFFTNTSNLLVGVSKGEINNYQDIEDFVKENPRSRSAKLMK
jgi:hypothetical protein